MSIIDPAQVWASLPPAAQAELGAFAFSLALGAAGCDDGSGPPQAYEAAEIESRDLLVDALHRFAPSLLADDAPRPDLSTLGIRSCRGCGCTDRCGYELGCWWIESDLSSSCSNLATSADVTGGGSAACST